MLQKYNVMVTFFFNFRTTLDTNYGFDYVIPLMETESNFSLIFEFSQELMHNPSLVMMST